MKVKNRKSFRNKALDTHCVYAWWLCIYLVASAVRQVQLGSLHKSDENIYSQSIAVVVCKCLPINLQNRFYLTSNEADGARNLWISCNFSISSCFWLMLLLFLWIIIQTDTPMQAFMISTFSPIYCDDETKTILMSGFKICVWRNFVFSSWNFQPETLNIMLRSWIFRWIILWYFTS